MNLRCIIIDDEPLALEKLQLFLSRIPDVQVVGSFTNCLDAIPAIRLENPDILFLDIEMEHLSGIEFLERIPVNSNVVIISAYEQYALKGYELEVADYLLKPYSFDRLLKTVEKIRAKVSSKVPVAPQEFGEFLFVKVDSRFIKIPYGDIQYVEGMRDYLSIHCKEKQTLASLTFSQLLKNLPPDSFLRVHKSYVVNLKHVDVVEKHEIWIGSHAIPIGQSYREEFYKRLEK